MFDYKKPSEIHFPKAGPAMPIFRHLPRYAQCFLTLLALLPIGHSSVVAQNHLICCGADRVFIIRVENDTTVPRKPVWTWKAEDSPRIPEAARKTFASTDECKPVGEFILITSSSGGVALVRRSDKQCHFYTQAKNAHSACLLPDDQVAVASSFGGDELLIYNLEKPSGGPAKPVAKMPLKGAHGTVWDKQRKRLWALGSEELLLVKLQVEKKNTELIVEQRLKLPTLGGHELSQSREQQVMFVTTDKHVYRFNKKSGSFIPDRDLADEPKVKSVTEHPQTGEIVYHQGTPENWWSDTIRFIGDREAIRLPDQRLYKVRWDF